jgi:hypothetical protein
MSNKSIKLELLHVMLMHEYLIFFQGFGKFQSIGGDGSGNGGAGSGGRISMDFADNKTYTGSFDTYGGLGKNNGSPGTSFFYHTGFLLITPSNRNIYQSYILAYTIQTEISHTEQCENE